LYNMQKRIDELNGKFELKSNIRKGTEISILVPQNELTSVS
jgi:signal transduction histidine kinase